MNTKTLLKITCVKLIITIAILFNNMLVIAQLNPSVKINNFQISYSDTIEKSTVTATLAFELSHPGVSKVLKVSLVNKKNRLVLYKNKVIVKNETGAFYYTILGQEPRPLVNSKIMLDAIITKIPFNDIMVQIILCKEDDHMLNIFMK